MNRLLEQEKLIFGDVDSLSIVDLSDGDSNSAFQVNERYLLKQFLNSTQLKKEVAGIYLFSLLAEVDVPMLISQGESYFVSEFITGSVPASRLLETKAISMEQVSSVVAKFVAKTYWKYRVADREKLKLFPSMSWEERLVGIIKGFKEYKPVILRFVSERQYNYMLKRIVSIDKDRSFTKNLTLTHRDLHTDNILVSLNVGVPNFYVIDFEHCMEGPVELEFQNSLLWNDSKSLDIKGVIRNLSLLYNVPYSEQAEKTLSIVYLIEQINLALAKQDEMKVKLLFEKYRTAWVGEGGED